MLIPVEDLMATIEQRQHQFFYPLHSARAFLVAPSELSFVL
jgi:DNA anti-recombination protein RmuC